MVEEQVKENTEEKKDAGDLNWAWKEEDKMETEDKKEGAKGDSKKMNMEYIPVDDSLVVSPENVRKMDVEKDLLSTIRTMENTDIGLQEPIQVRRKIDDSGQVVHLVVDGQRRARAAKILGWKEIPAIILGDDQGEDNDKIRSLLHDVTKANINPQDRADAVKELIEKFGSRRVVAQMLGVDTMTIAGWVGFDELPVEVKRDVGKKKEDGGILKTVADKHLVVSTLEGEERAELGRTITNMPYNKRGEALDIIKEKNDIKPEELVKELGKANIEISFRLNTRLSDALRQLAKETGDRDYNQLVGDIVVEKLAAKGLLVGI